MKKGQSLTREQIKVAKERIESSEEFDKFFITENGTLYGAKKLGEQKGKAKGGALRGLREYWEKWALGK